MLLSEMIDFNNLKRLSTPRGQVMSIHSHRLNRVIWYFCSTVLDNNDWEIIREISDMGLAANYWSVGDRKEVILNGSCGSLIFDHDAYGCYILGFDHNSEYEGTNRIHFQLGLGIITHLEDPYAVAFFADDNFFCMNPSGTNVGGWEQSFMRNTTCQQFKTCLPEDLQNVIKPVVKYTDNRGGGINTEDCITSTTEEIFLISEYELFGYNNYANSAEQNYQQQYDVFANANDLSDYTFRYKQHTAETTSWETTGWWLRSPTGELGYNGSEGFCASDNYSPWRYSSNDYEGFVPAFCV
jgi:hypothetical protein